METVRIRKCQCCPMPPPRFSVLVFRPWLRPFANRFANTNSQVRTPLTIIVEMVMGSLGFSLLSPMWAVNSNWIFSQGHQEEEYRMV